jgi:hypothetical protein
VEEVDLEDSRQKKVTIKFLKKNINVLKKMIVNVEQVEQITTGRYLDFNQVLMVSKWYGNLRPRTESIDANA